MFDFVQKTKRTGLLLSLLASFFVSAQEEEFINGVILDASDSTAVSFATVRIVNRAIGVITNSDGSFRLPVALSSYGDSLEISSLGYREEIIKFSDFSGDKAKTILLKPSVEELEEVVLTAERKRLGAEAIISRALYSIPFNYPGSAFSYTGYYRDYQWIYEEYTNLNEAIIQVYDKGFELESNESMDARILRLQQNNQFLRDSVYSVPYNYESNIKTIPNATIESYGGNELLILFIHDAIRNYRIGTFSYVDILKDDFLPNHQFNKDGLIKYNGDLIYRISISRQDNDFKVKGEIFVSATDFGIVKLDYQVYKLESKSSNYSAGIVEFPLYSVLVEYDRKDTYYLKYLSFRNHFEITPPPRFYPESLAFNRREYNFEIAFSQEAVTEQALDPRNYRIRYKGRRIHFDRVELVSSTNRIRLYPRLTPRINQILSDFNNTSDLKKDFKVKFGKITSVKGIPLNKTTTVQGDQYREFFVQQINRNPALPDETELMDKGKPIFLGQPLFTGELEADYWMNTPLKK